MAAAKPPITACPTCGQKTLRRHKRDIRGTYKGRPYVARNVEVEDCSNCGERLFDLEAMRKIESARTTPATRKTA